jgi:hypothetical protein
MLTIENWSSTLLLSRLSCTLDTQNSIHTHTWKRFDGMGTWFYQCSSPVVNLVVRAWFIMNFSIFWKNVNACASYSEISSAFSSVTTTFLPAFITIPEACILRSVFAATMATVDGNVTVFTEQVVKYRSERSMWTSIHLCFHTQIWRMLSLTEQLESVLIMVAH